MMTDIAEGAVPFYYSGVARPGPSRARPDLIIDYHMDITVLACTVEHCHCACALTASLIM